MVKRDNAKVAEWKKREVEEVKKLVSGKKVVGIINIHTLPSSQFQEIKKKLRGKADIKITRSNFIKRAFTDVDKGLEKLSNYIQGPSGIIVSKENPFSLYKFMKQSRSKTFAKPGMIAEEDIIVPAGETDLIPGPDLSQLKMVGLKVRIDKGKIVISEDSLAVKKGEKVSTDMASALSKLGITPREIGIEVNALLEEGMIYTPDVLDIDEEVFMQKLQNCYQNALNLSVNACYFNKVSLKFLLQKAYRNAINLAMEANIITKETIEEILKKASLNAQTLKSVLASKGYT